jgi:phospholipase/lecithinase/hemolysin
MYPCKPVQRCISLLIIPFWLLFAGLAQAAQHYSQVYVFGDSLSDTGNLASVAGPFPPPYYMNRVSNGPLAMEVMADKLGLDASASLHLIGPVAGSNYAVAGANADGDEAIDLGYQVQAFQANHGYVAPADALYVIFIGGNDVRMARDTPGLATAARTVLAAAARVEQAITELAAIGARSFMVINAPNIGVIPETRLLASAYQQPELVLKAQQLSQLYRVVLQRMVARLQHDRTLQVTSFDLFRFFDKLIKKAEALGFSNSTDACFSSQTFSFHPDCNFGQNFDQFIFFDEIHPSARVHAIVGDAFYRALQDKHDRHDDRRRAIRF